MNKNTKETIVAFVRLACMAITGSAAMLGFAIDAEVVYNVATVALWATALIWGWWRNNNVTAAATDAQEFVELFKNTEPRCDMEVEENGDEA